MNYIEDERDDNKLHHNPNEDTELMDVIITFDRSYLFKLYTIRKKKNNTKCFEIPNRS